MTRCAKHSPDSCGPLAWRWRRIVGGELPWARGKHAGPVGPGHSHAQMRGPQLRERSDPRERIPIVFIRPTRGDGGRTTAPRIGLPESPQAVRRRGDSRRIESSMRRARRKDKGPIGRQGERVVRNLGAVRGAARGGVIWGNEKAGHENAEGRAREERRKIKLERGCNAALIESCHEITCGGTDTRAACRTTSTQRTSRTRLSRRRSNGSRTRRKQASGTAGNLHFASMPVLLRHGLAARAVAGRVGIAMGARMRDACGGSSWRSDGLASPADTRLFSIAVREACRCASPLCSAACSIRNRRACSRGHREHSRTWSAARSLKPQQGLARASLRMFEGEPQERRVAHDCGGIPGAIPARFYGDPT